MEIIYCGGGNRRFYEIATTTGFLYGSQLPETVYGPLWFADQDWKMPDRNRYMAALAEHKPHMASVLDLERKEQLPEVLNWAEEAAQWVDVVMIIPKVMGIIACLPRSIGGAIVRLGYSVPTRFGATEVPQWEFAGWPVHLLGGTPHQQMRLYREMAAWCDVESIDGNFFMLKATKWCEHWDNGSWVPESGTTKHDAPYAAFERSCHNIIAAWRREVTP